MSDPGIDSWHSGQPYEQYVGRWSNQVARLFVQWLHPREKLAWADIGCGTGALASAVLAACDPRSVWGIDTSKDFLRQARQRLNDERVELEQGDAARLPWASQSVDVAVSGLVLNFVADQEYMLREMARVTQKGGIVGVYVWDYADGMRMIREFWDAAAEVDPAARSLDEGLRFPICHRDPLARLFGRVGLSDVEVTAIEIPTVFQDFDDYWKPFLGRTGPAPAYVASVTNELRGRIRDRLESRLATQGGGPISLRARAWAAKAVAG
jgi:SAM-dependent methyltransferase